MNEHIFRAANLPKEQVKLVEWKIKANSKLSKGSILFAYEYSTDDAVRTEKYKSHLNGITVKSMLNVKPGDQITKETDLFLYEKCSHPIIDKDMCGVCGEDLRKRAGNLAKKPLRNFHESASVPIIHADPGLKVSQEMALEIGKKDLINLIRNKKLVLLVDLDHTLIHTTNENVSNQLKGVYHYELWQRNVWYHTKFRPNCNRFLEEMSKMYELHIVTFGERSYAHKIANLMDPDRRFFHDRILSRNEIFNPASKTDNLKALFPRGDKMVCIIDDREDVWNYASNLICVQPYVYFKNTGDINDPSLFNKKPKHRHMLQQQQQQHQIHQQTVTNRETVKHQQEAQQEKEEVSEESTNKETNSASALGNRTTTKKTEKKVVFLIENDSSSSSSDSSNDTNNSSKSNDQDEAHEEKPSAKMANSNEDHDPDNYLDSLETILRSIHDEYYKIYEMRLKSLNKTQQDVLDETDLPDVKKVLPLIRSRVLENVVITFSGVVPTGYDLKKQRCYLMAKALGAKVNENLVLAEEEDELEEEGAESSKASRMTQYKYDDEYSSNSSGGCTQSSEEESVEAYGKTRKAKRYTTHLVAAKYGTSKVHDALKSKRQIKIVTPEWLLMCNYKWMRCDEEEFKLTKKYDYKTCSFHNEYNLHQKFSAVASSLETKQRELSVMNILKRNYKETSTQMVSESSLTASNSRQSISEDHRSKSCISFSGETLNKKIKLQAVKEEEKKTDSIASEFTSDLFDMMDKEVDEELGSEDDDDDQEEEEEEEVVEHQNDNEEENNSSSSSSLSSSSEQNNQQNETKKKITNGNGSSSSSISSSSSSDEENNDSLDSIDDEFVNAFERDFANKNNQF